MAFLVLAIVGHVILLPPVLRIDQISWFMRATCMSPTVYCDKVSESGPGRTPEEWCFSRQGTITYITSILFVTYSESRGRRNDGMMEDWIPRSGKWPAHVSGGDVCVDVL
jgi:hypothetical protein